MRFAQIARMIAAAFRRLSAPSRSDSRSAKIHYAGWR